MTIRDCIEMLVILEQNQPDAKVYIAENGISQGTIVPYIRDAVAQDFHYETDLQNKPVFTTPGIEEGVIIGQYPIYEINHDPQKT